MKNRVAKSQTVDDSVRYLGATQLFFSLVLAIFFPRRSTPLEKRIIRAPVSSSLIITTSDDPPSSSELATLASEMNLGFRV